MEKKVFVAVLALLMLLSLLPTAAIAAGTSDAYQINGDTVSDMLALAASPNENPESAVRTEKAITGGAAALHKNVNTANAPTVYFGQDHNNAPAAWRVIGYDGSGAAGASESMTLLAANTMGRMKFGSSSAYADSYLKTKIDELAGKLTEAEADAVAKRTLTSGSYRGELTDCVAGTAVNDAVFWPLSTAEALAVNDALRAVDPRHSGWVINYWWLRSPGDSGTYAAIVNGLGAVISDGNSVYLDYSALPAFHLDPDCVLFASAAADGKAGAVGSLAQVPSYAGSEWKLTLQDSSRSDFAVHVENRNGLAVNIYYSGAKTGENETISAVIGDENGNISHYGKLKQLSTADDENGMLEIDLSGVAVKEGSALYIFNEQCNGDKQTDYASELSEGIPICSISVAPHETEFPAQTEGYGEPITESFTVTNSGDEEIKGLSVSLGGANADAFALNTSAMETTLAANGSTTFAISPKPGLPAGRYTASVHVGTPDTVKIAVELSFTVNAKNEGELALEANPVNQRVQPITGVSMTVPADTVNKISTENPSAALTLSAKREQISVLPKVAATSLAAVTATSTANPTQLFKFELRVNGAAYTERFASPIRVSVTMNTPAAGNQIAVYRINGNNTLNRIGTASYDAIEETASISLGSFSLYAFVEEEIPTGGGSSGGTLTLSSPKTADIGFLPYALTALTSAAGAAVVMRRRKKF